MRIKLVLPLLLITVLAACGGASPGATTKPGATSGTAATNKPGAAVDCAAMTTAAQQLLAVQLLAQLIQSIKSKAIGNLDLDTFLAAMHTLHALDGHASVLGDPKAAIDAYENAAKAAKVLFATDPMTQTAIDTYNQNVGTVSDFLSHQAAISGALSEAGC
jgi:hypothetical protein